MWIPLSLAWPNSLIRLLSPSWKGVKENGPGTGYKKSSLHFSVVLYFCDTELGILSICSPVLSLRCFLPPFMFAKEIKVRHNLMCRSYRFSVAEAGIQETGWTELVNVLTRIKKPPLGVMLFIILLHSFFTWR